MKTATYERRMVKPSTPKQTFTYVPAAELAEINERIAIAADRVRSVVSRTVHGSAAEAAEAGSLIRGIVFDLTFEIGNQSVAESALANVLNGRPALQSDHMMALSAALYHLTEEERASRLAVRA